MSEQGPRRVSEMSNEEMLERLRHALLSVRAQAALALDAIETGEFDAANRYLDEAMIELLNAMRVIWRSRRS